MSADRPIWRDEKIMTQTVRPAPNRQTLARVPIESKVQALTVEKRRSDCKAKIPLWRSPLARPSTTLSPIRFAFSVAAAILAAVEGGILPPGKKLPVGRRSANIVTVGYAWACSAGQDARLYGRRDARRYAAKHIPHPMGRGRG